MPALLSSGYRERCLWQVQTPPPEATAGDLPAVADVVVMGAGICGLSAAATLAAAGRHVVVLDREPLGWGASTRNGGMVIPELTVGPAALEKRHGRLGRRLYDEVNEAFDFVEAMVAGADGGAGIDCDYRRHGQLYLAHATSRAEQLRTLAEEHAARGEPVRFVPRHELSDEVGSDAFFGGVVFERTGGLHPARFHAGLARRALDAGGAVHDRCAVTAIETVGGRHRVHTTRGTVTSAQVIVATNAEADGATPWLARRVLPVGSYIIATEVLDQEVAASVSPRGRMMVDTREFLAYWRLTPDGRMAFGGRRSLDPVEVHFARDQLYEQMLVVHPQLEGVAIEYAWGGTVAITLDRLPHVGMLPGAQGSAWYATGCNGSGVALNTWMGHRLGLHLLGDAPPPAAAELTHRAIPASSLRAAYLPVVGRWFSFKDRR